MNIAMLSYHTCPRASVEGKLTGGMNVYILELSRALVARGHSVDIFTRSHEENDPLILNDEKRLRFIHIPAGPHMLLSKKNLVSLIPKFAEGMLHFIKEGGFVYDVVHAHYYMSGLVAKRIFAQEKKLFVARATFVMSFHTLALMKNLVARDTLERESQFRIRSEFRLMKSADGIVASSRDDKEYTQYLYNVPGNKIHVVSPGINADLFHPIARAEARGYIHADHGHKIVLFVGRIEPLKGIDTLMYAMKILKGKYPDQMVCLWIVGGDISEPVRRWPRTLRALSHLRKNLGLPEECIHFVGQQPQTELPYYYNAADVVVMPSHYESFGMSALEAMGCGVPIITTNVAGIASTIDDQYASLISSVNNPLLLATQIENVLSDTAASTAFAHHIRMTVSDFTWSRVAEHMLNVYRPLVSSV